MIKKILVICTGLAMLAGLWLAKPEGGIDTDRALVYSVEKITPVQHPELMDAFVKIRIHSAGDLDELAQTAIAAALELHRQQPNLKRISAKVYLPGQDFAQGWAVYFPQGLQSDDSEMIWNVKSRQGSSTWKQHLVAERRR